MLTKMHDTGIIFHKIIRKTSETPTQGVQAFSEAYRKQGRYDAGFLRY